MRLETLDAGHWGSSLAIPRHPVPLTSDSAVHAERPHEFKQLLLDFLGKGPA
jgi:hypothetical protein